MTVPDDELMRRTQAGDTAAFEDLVCRYRPALLRLAVSKLADRTAAEDAVQEALLAAYAARHTFNPAFAFRTWLWTILLHVCQRSWKRGERRAVIQGRPAGSPGVGVPAGGDTALERLLREERADQLHAALSCLPEAEADAIRLRFFGGLKFDEIAAAMNSSVSGAKQRVKHGLERLAAHLQQMTEVES
jgi:RNA polymerase sigma-70 factor (ECF subfamily)